MGIIVNLFNKLSHKYKIHSIYLCISQYNYHFRFKSSWKFGGHIFQSSNHRLSITGYDCAKRTSDAILSRFLLPIVESKQ
jgi:hypothetical protein